MTSFYGSFIEVNSSETSAVRIDRYMESMDEEEIGQPY